MQTQQSFPSWLLELLRAWFARRQAPKRREQAETTTGTEEPPTAPGRPLESVDQHERALVDMVNRHRRAHGLGPLGISPLLTSAAHTQSVRMAEENHFDHEWAGNTFRGRLQASGYRYREARENIAQGTTATPSRVFSMWRTSKGHNDNMLLPRGRDCGIARVKQEGVSWWTMVVAG